MSLMPDPRVRAKLRSAMSLRLTDEQAEYVRSMSDAQDVSPSEATRQLVQLGMALSDAGRHGIVLSDAAARLIAAGDAPALTTIARYPTLEEMDTLGVPAGAREQLDRGAMLIITVEEARSA